MRRFTMTMLMLLMMSIANAQVVRNGNTFEKVNVSQTTMNSTKTEYTYKDGKGNELPIYLTKNGRAYVMAKSKDGKDYRRYMTTEVSKTICKEMGVEYVEKIK